MESEIRVMDQFINEEGSDQERYCWRKIRSAMCEANSNAVLSDERAKYEEIIYDLVFAYVNKDNDCPHEFERDALINAYNILTQKHHVKFVDKVIEKISTFFA